MLKAKGFLHQFQSGKTYAYGTERNGRPVVYVHVRLHKLFDQSAKALEDYVIAQMENVRFLLVRSLTLSPAHARRPTRPTRSRSCST